jgi:predicted dehydrogenase
VGRPIDRVRLGVVGIGNIAPLNVAGYLADERCDVVALCEPRLDKARALASAWSVPTCYEHLDDLLGDDTVDAVEILTPTYLHHEHVLAALAAGKHVSCQKPLANTVGEALELAAAADAATRYLRVSECYCHYPPLERAREIVASGAIGEPVGLRVKTVCGFPDSEFEKALEVDGYLWRIDARSPGGHAFDDMVHKFALAEWLVDQPVTRVRAVMRREDLFYEPFAAILEYGESRLLGVMDSHYAKDMPLPSRYYSADEFFEVQGTEGLVIVTRGGGELLGLPPLLVHDRNGRRDEDVAADWGAGFDRAARHFVDALLEDRQPDMTPAAAVRAMQVCFAVYESARTGLPVEPASMTGAVVAQGWPT